MLSAQDKKELAVFAEFARLCPLGIKLGSLEKRPVGEPDIRCVLHDDSELNFELTEIIDSAAARNQQLVQHELTLFEDYLSRRSEEVQRRFHATYSGAMFHVTFHPKSSRGARSKAGPALVDYLCSADFSKETFLIIPTKPEFKAIATVQIHRYDFSGAEFTVSGGGALSIPVNEAIRAKFAMRFASSRRTHLLAYTDRVSSVAYDAWLPRLVPLLEREMSNSCFEKVWVFDYRHNCIIFEYPGGSA